MITAREAAALTRASSDSTHALLAIMDFVFARIAHAARTGESAIRQPFLVPPGVDLQWPTGVAYPDAKQRQQVKVALIALGYTWEDGPEAAQDLGGTPRICVSWEKEL